MFITFLGSCANQTSNREGVAFIVETENTNVLVDAGPGIVAAFQRINRETSDIDNLILTHTHGDHILGFAYFVWNRNFERKGRAPAHDLNVYGNYESIEAAQKMLSSCYPNASFDFRVNYYVISVHKQINVGDLTFTPVNALHPVPTIAFTIETADKKIVYSADSLPCEDLMKYSQNADLVIHEGMFTNDSLKLSRKVMHSTASDAGRFAQSSNCKQLLLVHIAPELFGKENALLKEASLYYAGCISIPCDGSLYMV